MKKFLFALIVCSFAAPVAEAAKAPRKGKSEISKALRSKATVNPRRAARPLVHREKITRIVAASRASDDPTQLDVKSTAALVIEQGEGRILFAKNVDTIQPIASITKLMTAMVVLDAGLELRQGVAIAEDDVDLLKHTRSRLKVGTVLERTELLRLALMASENRAAAALGRAYPGGIHAFVAAMNKKAMDLGMMRTRFVDSSGLSSDNVSTAQDLAKMVVAAHRYPLIQEYTTLPEHVVRTSEGSAMAFRNTNGLVKDIAWHIDLSKTGYISEAGRCLVMQARIGTKPVIIVLLDSWGRYTRIGDANRIKKWVESAHTRVAPG